MKKIKIHKRYHGDEFIFEAVFYPDSTNCSIRQLCTDKVIPCKLYPDFKTVCLSESIWIEGINGDHGKYINYLTINKHKVNDIKEYTTPCQ